jgi:hypothetical protein
VIFELIVVVVSHFIENKYIVFQKKNAQSSDIAACELSKKSSFTGLLFHTARKTDPTFY